MADGRLAILNGFGRSLGDSIIGLQALHAAQSLAGFPRPVLVRQDFRSPLLDQIYGCADFADVMVTEDEKAPGFDRIIDIRDFAFDPRFRGVAMVDFFLARLGLNPEAVPGALKHNRWLAPRIQPMAPKGLPDSYVLVCPGASMAIRDMPQAIHARILLTCLAHQGLPVITQGDPADTSAIAIGPVARLEELCGLVAGAACVISTDTAMVHLADAFSVPCLAVFTTHRPEWRVRDYPDCEALHLPVAGLPEALEFCRGDEDLAAIASAWHGGAGTLEKAVGRFLTICLPATMPSLLAQ